MIQTEDDVLLMISSTKRFVLKVSTMMMLMTRRFSVSVWGHGTASASRSPASENCLHARQRCSVSEIRSTPERKEMTIISALRLLLASLHARIMDVCLEQLFEQMPPTSTACLRGV